LSGEAGGACCVQATPFPLHSKTRDSASRPRLRAKLNLPNSIHKPRMENGRRILEILAQRSSCRSSELRLDALTSTRFPQIFHRRQLHRSIQAARFPTTLNRRRKQTEPSNLLPAAIVLLPYFTVGCRLGADIVLGAGGIVDCSFLCDFFSIAAVFVRSHSLRAGLRMPSRVGCRPFSGAAFALHSSATSGGSRNFHRVCP
jgi:hypothetical protein